MNKETYAKCYICAGISETDANQPSKLNIPGLPLGRTMCDIHPGEGFTRFEGFGIVRAISPYENGIAARIEAKRP